MAIKDLYPSIAPSLNLDFANTKALDPKITFARASTGTYYGTRTAKAEENLFQYSQEFEQNYWVKSNATVTANTETAPDGTTTADTLTFTTGAGLLNTTVGGFDTTKSYTFSVWMRVASGTLEVNLGSINAGVFATQTVTTTWTRFSVTQTPSATTRFPGILANGTTGSVYIWGAQLEQRSAVTAYTPTTTQPITNYIPVLETASANVARFDHDPVTGESLGLLVEEQRTNLLTYSEDFSNAAWGKARASVTSNTIVAPDGTLTGDKLVEDTTASSTHLITQSNSLTAGTYTYYLYAKAGERGFLNVGRANGFIDSFGHSFNLSEGTATGTNCSIQSVGNGWYRCSGQFVVNTTGSTGVNFQISLSGTSSTYTGDGYSGIYIWGAQLEAGAFPTSYIKTEASQVTRSTDSAIMTGTNFSDWFNNGQGSVYSEHDAYAVNVQTQGVWQLYGGATTTSLRHPQGTIARLRAAVGGVFSGAGTGASITSNTFIKATIAWDGLSGRLQSGSVGEDVTASANLDATRISVGALGTGSFLNGHIRKLSFYPQRLTNTQLQALTS